MSKRSSSLGWVFVWGPMTKNQRGKELVNSKWKTTKNGAALPASPVTSLERGGLASLLHSVIPEAQLLCWGQPFSHTRDFVQQ